MNETKYYAIELWIDPSDDYVEVMTELEEHLYGNGYDFFTASRDYDTYLLIAEEYVDYIDTILEDRNIKFWYR